MVNPLSLSVSVVNLDWRKKGVQQERKRRLRNTEASIKNLIEGEWSMESTKDKKLLFLFET